MAKKVDYNLLHVYLLIHKHRSLSLVAKQLGCTDSAVSKMLSKLREGFNDQLFVRHTSGLEPTALTEWLAPKIEIKLTALDAVIDEAIENAFETERHVVISLLPVDISLFGSVLYSQLSQFFPDVKFSLVSWAENTPDKIASKEVDFAVGPSLDNNSKLCYQTVMFDTSYNLVVPEKDIYTSWHDYLKYRLLRQLVPGWNIAKRPITEMLDKQKIPYYVDDLTDFDDISYANNIMLANKGDLPYGIGLFSHQIDKFKQNINSNVYIVNPSTFGEFKIQSKIEFCLYEYVGNRGNYFYDQVKSILQNTLNPKNK
ncbi:LysR family transcriptional regulator [Vibrio algarum]|uniref:LysR family transcriptional regulator n=1 Tax=Vibrio algarum TaxID=3020714 RepID=A0ABT4YN18_9VIBR|nr:LysR family transcriptional regulator [Vibrio sp. KJ40-1]MDB1122936.1 LysR family transcriptional regulator [Vibrio sp. KJ40-1]